MFCCRLLNIYGYATLPETECKTKEIELNKWNESCAHTKTETIQNMVGDTISKIARGKSCLSRVHIWLMLPIQDGAVVTVKLAAGKWVLNK